MANAGNATNVTQNIQNVNSAPALPSDVLAFLLGSASGHAQAAAYQAEAEAASPDKGRLSQIATGIKTTVEGASVATEVLEHAHEWFGGVMDFVSSLL